MKSNRFLLIKAIIVMSLLICILCIFNSCGGAPNYDDVEVTSEELEALVTWGEDHDIDENHLREIFYYEISTNVYRKNISTSPLFYYAFDNSALGDKCEECLTRIQNKYFEQNDTINFSFRFSAANSSNSPEMQSKENNSIGDRWLSCLNYEYDATCDGEIAYQYYGNKYMLIKSTQIWLPSDKLCEKTSGFIQSVVLHELGHAIGLLDIYDSNYKNDTIMWKSAEYFKGRTDEEYYYDLDIIAINTLYSN